MKANSAGLQLRQLREASQVPLDVAASLVLRSAVELARYEAGEEEVPVADFRALVTEYSIMMSTKGRGRAEAGRRAAVSGEDILVEHGTKSHGPTVLDQLQLDVSRRFRTARLPWRGQFAPELVEYLMDALFPGSPSFYDPFCGSGTVLFEAARRGSAATGLEVNPAAWHMSVLSSFSSLERAEKRQIVTDLKRRMASIHTDVEIDAACLLASAPSEFSRLVLSAAIIVGMGNDHTLTGAALVSGYSNVLKVLQELEPGSSPVNCYLQDARHSGIADESVDGVITSPPYINVFNYHQNFRPAAEMLGWKPLQAAQVEIGANRKFRGNRFMTVIQYALDMHQALVDTARVMRSGSSAVVILGRTSKVLGTPFENGKVVRRLAEICNAFSLTQSAERAFVNRFGEEIKEDVIVLQKTGYPALSMEEAREVGVAALKGGLDLVPSENREALEAAIAQAVQVQPSMPFALDVPPHFATYGSNHGRRS